MTILIYSVMEKISRKKFYGKEQKWTTSENTSSNISLPFLSLLSSQSFIWLSFLQDFSLKEVIHYFCFSDKANNRTNMTRSFVQNWDLVTVATWLSFVLNFVRIINAFYFSLNRFCFKMEHTRTHKKGISNCMFNIIIWPKNLVVPLQSVLFWGNNVFPKFQMERQKVNLIQLA